MDSASIKAPWEILRDSLGELPRSVARPVLVVTSGLPGTGKSYFSRRLVDRFPLVILESDALRRTLFGRPTYSALESAELFQACHRLVERLLYRGVSILLDATSLAEAHREPLYQIADRAGAKLILVRTEAPASLVRHRLERRKAARQRQDNSEADWAVHQRMRASVEPIARTHFVLDTSRDIAPALEGIIEELEKAQDTDREGGTGGA